MKQTIWNFLAIISFSSIFSLFSMQLFAIIYYSIFIYYNYIDVTLYLIYNNWYFSSLCHGGGGSNEFHIQQRYFSYAFFRKRTTWRFIHYLTILRSILEKYFLIFVSSYSTTKMCANMNILHNWKGGSRTFSYIWQRFFWTARYFIANWKHDIVHLEKRKTLNVYDK